MQAVYWNTLKAQGPHGLGPPWTPSEHPPWAPGHATASGNNNSKSDNNGNSDNDDTRGGSGNSGGSNTVKAALDELVVDLVLWESERSTVHRGR